MRVSHVALDDYRSYKHAVVEFQPGITVLIGSNGQGKTNLVEAIAYLSAFSSHRVSAETALVRLATEGENPIGGAVIRVKLIRGEHIDYADPREHIIELELVRGKANRALLNRTQVKPRDIVGMVKTVVFAPEDLQLIRSEPALRRAFLDDLVIQSSPIMAGVKADFDKVSRQRAAVLKHAQVQMRRGQRPDTSTLDIWNEQFAALSARMTAQRAQVVEQLRDPTARAYDLVADSPKHVDIALNASIEEYFPHALANIDDLDTQRQLILKALDIVREKEIERGVNLVGAHRDDLMLKLGQMPVKGYASHGESWSVALALKLAAFDVLTENDEQPILILDDVFAELDSRRRRGLAHLVKDVQQVFITAAVAQDVPKELHGNIIYVRADERDGTQVSTKPFTNTTSINDELSPPAPGTDDD